MGSDSRRKKIIQMAKDKYYREGEIEIDGNAKLSEGSDNGTYVEAWVWVSFAGTEFDKDKK